MHVAYFTSKTGNTKRFTDKLGFESSQISTGLIIPEPFVLLCPTYADRHGNHCVPTPVIKFLNDERNRNKLLGVVGFGNRNFGNYFAIASEVISAKCKVPLLYKVELFGTSDDVQAVKERIINVFS